MRILILKPSSLGDVIHAVPVLRNLRLAYPDAVIDWWIARGLMPLLEHDADLNECLPFERDRLSVPVHWPGLFQSVRELRRRRYDLVIDLQGLLRSAVFGWGVSGDQLIGVDDWREAAPLFYDRVIPKTSAVTHAVDRYLGVLPQLGLTPRWDFTWLAVHEPSRGAIHDAFSEEGPWVVVQPGARWATKKWPSNRFAETIELLKERVAGVRFAILGGAEDQPLGAEIAAHCPGAVDLTGRISLSEMIEWLRRAKIMITNDTGPMHVAAAVGTRVVSIFGPTDPRLTGPYGQEQWVVQSDLDCAPCLKSFCRRDQQLQCLQDTSAAAVCERVMACLKAPCRPRWAVGD